MEEKKRKDRKGGKERKGHLVLIPTEEFLLILRLFHFFLSLQVYLNVYLHIYVYTYQCLVYVSIFTYYFQAYNSHPVLYILAFRLPRLPPLIISPLLPSPSLLLSSHLFILFLPSSVLSSFLLYNFFTSLLHSAHLISYILQDGIGSRDQWTFSYCEMHIRSDLV